MDFYTQQHKHYCGIELQARAMYVCILDPYGTKLVHKNLPTTPEAFLRVIAPYRADLGVGVEWYVHVVLAGGPLPGGRHRLCPGPCSLYEGEPWRQSQERRDCCPQDRGAAAGRDVPPGLCLSGGDARDPRFTAPPLSSGTQTCRTLSAHPQYIQHGLSGTIWTKCPEPQAMIGPALPLTRLVTRHPGSHGCPSIESGTN
jgi:hypothetical protein